MTSVATPEIPLDRLAGLKQNWRSDILSGFIIFLIALPLSLGIAIASGMPPLAGIFAAIVGGIIVSQVSGSYVTINGPAAGLIVVIFAAVDKLGGGDKGYHGALACIVVSGVSLLTLGLLKAGRLGTFFPSTVVHGMLASIGIVIMVKQLPLVVGCKPPAKEPLVLITKIPEMFMHMNPHIAIVGFTCMAILIIYTMIKNKVLQKIPAPIIMVTIAIAMGSYFQFTQAHTYTFAGQEFAIDPAKALVVLPANLVAGITQPDWSQIGSMTFWSCAISITLVQGIETLLSAAAVDKLDPCRRQSNLSRDVAAVGLGTAVSGMIGGLPMIAEIVRSSANIANGAKTRWSNFFHGTFMLIMALIGAQLIDMIPMAALAALLVFTGYRLASPKVFLETHKVGQEQTLLFVVTIVAALATDLLIGVFTGVALKFILHLARGAEIGSLFKVKANVVESGTDHYTVNVESSAIFSNYISLESILNKLPHKKTIVVDLSKCKLVDHSVMEHLSHMKREYVHEGGIFDIVGLQEHSRASVHPLASAKLKAS
jgi:MFS superfamily sulfate permease-like transporter